MPTPSETGRVRFDYRVRHFSEMPLGLVGDEWAPRGAEFEKARQSTARALSRLAKVKVEADGVQDWEVRSWLRHKHYGDPTMQGLHAAIRAEVLAVLTEQGRLTRPVPPELFNRGGSNAE